MKQQQSGFFLLEALIAILIFSLGVLGMIALGGAAISGQTDARIRTDAANFAEQLAGKMELSVDRTSDATLAASLAAFSHYPVNPDPATNPPYCSFNGTRSTAAIVGEWGAKVTGAGGLPGASDTDALPTLSVYVDTTAAGQNAVTITECWQGPKDAGKRRFMTTVYINR